MATEAFREIKLRTESLTLVGRCNTIIDDYTNQGLRMTLRQLYYQLVTRNLITNQEKSYKKLSGLVSDARLSGLMDWDAIEDRGRQPEIPLEFENIQERVQAAVNNYRLPRWTGQDSYVELWVEKQALAGVLQPLARDYHVTLMVNKGYSSQSAMYESANRFTANCDESGRAAVLLYLGDHDPSGEDMVRDIRSRLTMFGVQDIDVRKLALTIAQVRQYNPPPNPAKITDPRAADYIAEFGPSSWEVDALPPNVLAGIIRQAFEGLIDQPLMDAVIAREETDRQALLRAAQRIMRRST